MKIKLNEIPQDGRRYEFNRKTAELNDDLKTIISENNYDIQFYINPLNSKDYELKGTISTQTQEMCSLCGDTFNFSVQAKLHEILIQAPEPEKELEKQSRSNHFSELNESGPSVIEYKEDEFDVGSFSYEAIALSIPFNPKPEKNNDGSCKVCLKMNMNTEFKYDEDMSIFEKAKSNENPFSILKNIKPN